MQPTHIVDVGASAVDGPAPYLPMVKAGLARVTGFEPQQGPFEELVAGKGPNETYKQSAILDGKEHTLFLAEYHGMTSILKVSEPSIGLFDNSVSRWGKVIGTEQVQTITLDEALGDDLPDFLKMDIQGSELAVLKASPRALRAAVAVQLEISFIPLYIDQPPFGEVDLFMCANGFLPHCFTEIKIAPLGPGPIRQGQQLRQLLEADIVYIRDIRDPSNLSSHQWYHLGQLAEHVFGSSDLALRARSMVVAADVAA